MLKQWSRLGLYVAVGMTIVAVLFPPFDINNGPVEYGFILSGPPSVRQALAQATAFGGQQGREMASRMVHYGIDVIRLVIELVAIWGIYLALKRTVLEPIAF